MRVSPVRRRRWNNIMIIGIITFIVLLNAPMLIKTYLLDPPVSTEKYPHLLDTQHAVTALYFNRWQLKQNSASKKWESNLAIDIPVQQYIEHWQSLQGTEVNQDTYHKIVDKLGAPTTVEIWYQDVAEPQRITMYRTDKFWLMNNWQQQWIAISLDEHYLLPASALTE